MGKEPLKDKVSVFRAALLFFARDSLCDYGGLFGGLKNLMIENDIKAYHVVVGIVRCWGYAVAQKKKDGSVIVVVC